MGLGELAFRFEDIQDGARIARAILYVVVDAAGETIWSVPDMAASVRCETSQPIWVERLCAPFLVFGKRLIGQLSQKVP